MIVYVETNFLLEVAYQQDGCESCRQILMLARQGKLTLIVPAFSLIEARQTWKRRNSERNALQTQLQPVIRQLARSEPFRTVTESSRELLAALLASGEDSRLRLEEAISALIADASVLPFSTEIAARARQEELTFGLSPSDAVVYATVISHLEKTLPGPKCFLNRDSKGFANPSMDQQLALHDCKLIGSFEQGLAFIQSELTSQSSSLPFFEDSRITVPSITSDQALRIARQDAERIFVDLLPYRAAVSLEQDGWHVDYELKLPHLQGAGARYVIHAEDGAILARQLEQ